VYKQETNWYTVNQRTPFRDRYSPDLIQAEERGHGKGMEVDTDISTAKAMEP